MDKPSLTIDSGSSPVAHRGSKSPAPAGDVQPSREAESYVVDGIIPQQVIAPKTVAELAQDLAHLNHERNGVIPWGSGTRMNVGNLPTNYHTAVVLRELSNDIEHVEADMVCRVTSSATFGEVERTLAADGMRLPFTAAANATIGGVIASDAPSCRMGALGGVREWILGLEVVRADGRRVKSGGNVVKNVQGFDLHRLHTGAFGTLGIITKAAIKLIPNPVLRSAVKTEFNTYEDLARAIKRLMRAPLTLDGTELSTDLNGTSTNTTLLVQLAAGNSATLERKTALTQEAVTTTPGQQVSVLADSEAASFDSHNETTDNLSFRATLRPSKVANFIEQTKATALGLNVRSGRIVADPLFAWVLVEATADSSELALQMITNARDIALFLQGYLVMETASPEVKKEVEMFGYSLHAIDLMRKIKAQFDPAAILNAGRFAWFI